MQQQYLNSLEVSGPLVFTTAPVAAAFGVAPVAGVINEARSGVAALVAHHHALGDSFEVLRVALGRRSVPLTQSAVFDVSTSHPLFDAISSARGALAAYVSAKLATRDDGNLEMPCDDLWRAGPDFVTKLIEGKWKGLNWHADVLRPILLARCKFSAPAAVGDTDRQWFCTRSHKVVTFADRGLAILGYDRNSLFLTTVMETLEIADTTPGTAAAKSECQSHAALQIAERLDAAAARYRTYLGASSCVTFPSFTDDTDKAASMQVEAVAARQLVTVISRVMPSAMNSVSGARAGGGKAADGDDDDDDDDGGGLSKSAKKKRNKELNDARQQANRDNKKVKLELRGNGGGRGGGKNGGGRGDGKAGGGDGSPGDLSHRVVEQGGSAVFSWPSGRHGQQPSKKTFDVTAIKKSLLAAGNASASKLCVGFQFMYALSSNFEDDDKRLAYAHRFCAHAGSKHHDSVTADAHVQLPGLDRALLLQHQS